MIFFNTNEVIQVMIEISYSVNLSSARLYCCWITSISCFGNISRKIKIFSP